MSKSNFSEFIDAYNKASDNIRGIIDGPVIIDKVDELTRDSGSTESKRALVNLIVDVTLGIIGVRAMEEILRTDERFKGLYTKELVDRIETFIKSVGGSGENKFVPRETETPEIAKVVDEKNIGSMPLVKPLRTFSDDAHNVHGYGSFRREEGNGDESVHRSEQSDVLPQRNQDDTNTQGQ